jgi:SOS response regulatory protein OraA/RecX
VSQENARRSASDYLDYSAFSRSGLIEQLVYEGFTQADATYAVDALNVNWNEQAAKSAAEYLAYSAFSRSGLIEQLVYEGFTQEQAEYGVSTTGL